MVGANQNGCDSLDMIKFIYSPAYEVDIGAHVFPTCKYHLIKDELKKLGFSEKYFIEPEPADKENIELVHTSQYIKKLEEGTLSPVEILALELPYSKELVEASFLCAGGTIKACFNALEDKIGIHIGGGFHHAFPDHGEGFCVLNDVAVGIKTLFREKKIKKALIIDCDLHQGNGTAYIFFKDRNVFTFSIHQRNNYPLYKPPSNLDIGLYDGVQDKEYLERLDDALENIINDFPLDFLLYIAGADPYINDQLGNFGLTMEGLRMRDVSVFAKAKEDNIPVCVVLAGGYAYNITDTVKIHLNTIIKGIEILYN